MSEFSRSVLGDLIVHQKGFPFKSRDYQEDGVPVVRVSNFTDDSIDASDLKFVSENIASENQKVALRTDDVIIATVGSWPKNPASIVGKTICVPPEMDGALMNQNSVILRVKSNSSVDQKYLFIALKTKLFSEYLVSTAQGSANQASVTLSDIFSYEIEWPEKEIRESIVSMIDSMNQKIKLNRQTNQTLEHIAQAIFKSWFVDFEPTRAKIAAKQIAQARQDGERGAALKEALLADDRWPEAVTTAIAEGDPERAAMAAISGKSLDELSPEQQAQLLTTVALFPDALIDSELGEIPEGWKVSNLIAATSKIGSGATPRGGKKAYKDEGVSQIRSMNIFDGRFSMKDLAKIDEAQAKKLKNVVIEENDVLINITGASVTRCCIVPPSIIPARVNQHVCIVRANGTTMNPYYIYQSLTSSAGKSILNSLAQAGATREALTKAHIENFEMLVPDEKVMSGFGQMGRTIEEKRFRLTEVGLTLTEMRDALLSKLLSGELKASPNQTELDKTA